MIVRGGYTIAQAARRVGCSEANVRKWVRDGSVELISVSGKSQRIRASDIDALRRSRLARFDDVIDASATDSTLGDTVPAPTSTEPEVVGELRSRVAVLQAQLRQVLASRATINEGLALVLRGEQGLLDTILAGLPQDDAEVLRAGSFQGSNDPSEPPRAQ